MGERIALVTVCSMAAAMPSSVLGDFESELPVLAAVMEAARVLGLAAAGRSPR
ncbi:hypothetical protein ACFV1W_35595 [Kitasatospora sp. NPDC059648]|uniref:hypothetical protein n=1 Tax=Kitasatospora sp. NPDC059648 TaxID=3346894 RepID=UPI003696B1C7